MKDIADKSDSTAGSVGELPAAEYNDHKNELQTAVENTGQTLSAAVTDQLSKALFINGVATPSVIDSGSINSILLSPVTGASGLTVPSSYAELDGAILVFEKADVNTSTAVLVNFGQTGTELGAKTLVRIDASVPAIGDVKGRCVIQWDNTNDRWVLLNNGANSFIYPVSATGTVTPKFNKNMIVSDTSGGANVITVAGGDFHGQKVTILCNGSSLTEATFTGKISTLNVSISDGKKLSLEWDESQSIWVATNEITADFTSGSYRIKQWASGRMKVTLAFSGTTTTAGALTWFYYQQTFISPIAFNKNIDQTDPDFNVETITRGTSTDRPSAVSLVSPPYTTTVATFRTFIQSSGATVDVIASIEGPY